MNENAYLFDAFHLPPIPLKIIMMTLKTSALQRRNWWIIQVRCLSLFLYRSLDLFLSKKSTQQDTHSLCFYLLEIPVAFVRIFFTFRVDHKMYFEI